jgi:hypothetical protein
MPMRSVRKTSSSNSSSSARVEVLVEVTINISHFSGVTPYSPVDKYIRLRKHCFLQIYECDYSVIDDVHT